MGLPYPPLTQKIKHTRQWFNLSICIVFNFQRASKHTRKDLPPTLERRPPVRVTEHGLVCGQAKSRIAIFQGLCQPSSQLIFKNRNPQTCYLFNCRLKPFRALAGRSRARRQTFARQRRERITNEKRQCQRPRHFISSEGYWRRFALPTAGLDVKLFAPSTQG